MAQWHMYGLGTRGGNEFARNMDSISRSQGAGARNDYYNQMAGTAKPKFNVNDNLKFQIETQNLKNQLAAAQKGKQWGSGGSGWGGAGGSGGPGGSYATSIQPTYRDQSIQEARNSAHANAVQNIQNPNSPLAQRLNSMAGRFGANSGLAQGAGIQAQIATDALGREQARQGENQMREVNQRDYHARSQEGLGLLNAAMSQDQAAANRAASMQQGLLSGILSLMR